MSTLLRSLLVSLALTSGLASAQATAVWVSGVGDDANPCSRTAPCLTLAGALPKVANGGEIRVLDPLSLGVTTISKSVTVTAESPALILASSSAGVHINAPGAVVKLRNLGLLSLASGVSAIDVQAASAVYVDGCQFKGFSGDVVSSSSDGGALFIDGSDFRGNTGRGVAVFSTAPQQTVISDSLFRGHTTALAASGNTRVTLVDVELASNSGPAVLVENGAQLNVERGQLVDSAVGVESRGGVARLSNAQLSGNGATTRTIGDSVVHSFGNNRITPSTCSLAAIPVRTAVVGTALPLLALEGTGLLGNVSWAAAFPDGVGVDAGTLAGTPLAVGAVVTTLTATDQRGCMATTPFALDVVCPVLSLAPTALAAVETGAALTPVVFVVNGSTSATNVVSINGALPIGVRATDGGLSGVPTEAGSFPLAVSAVDGFGCTATQMVTLTVTASSTFQPTVLRLSLPNPPAWVGEAVQIEAALDPVIGAPTGTMRLFEGTVELASTTVPTTGIAAFTLSTLTEGTHVLTAEYSGDSTFGGSRAAPFSFEVLRIPTSTTLRLEGAELIADVTSTVATPEGQLEFAIDGVTQSPLTLVSGSARTAAPTVAGSHTALARFVGGARFAASESSTVAISVVVDGGMQTADAGTQPGDELPKPGCGCGQVDVGAVLFAALALIRRRAKS